MTALEHFRQQAPEFNNLADEVVSAWLTSAIVFITATTPATEKSKLLNALYAAHLCWMNKYQTGGHRGPITAEQWGEEKRTYKPVQGSDSFLGQSRYGLLYKELSGAGMASVGAFTRFGDTV